MAKTSSSRSSNTSFGARRGAADSSFCGGAILGIGTGGRAMGRGGATSCAPALTAGVAGAAPISVLLAGSGCASRLDLVDGGFFSGFGTYGVIDMAMYVFLDGVRLILSGVCGL